MNEGRLHDQQSSDLDGDARSRKRFVYFIGLTSSLAGLLFGMDQGVITGALPFIVKEFQLGPVSKGMIVSFLFIGALLGTAISTAQAKIFGANAVNFYQLQVPLNANSTDPSSR